MMLIINITDDKANYLQWMLSDCYFTAEVCDIVRAALEGKLPQWE